MEDKMKKYKDELLKLIKQLQKEVTCPICLEFYTDPICLSECNHTFCKSCFSNLINTSTKPNCVDCPLCKHPVNRRNYENDEKIAEIVKLVQKYKIILLKQPLELKQPQKCYTPKRTRTPKTPKTSAKKRKSTKKNETEYNTLPIQKSINLKKAKSLGCLSENITKERERRPKRHSLGNTKELDKDQLSELFSTQNIRNFFANDRQVIELMEEDCLANLEEAFRKDEVAEPSTSKKKTKRIESPSADNGWNRMKSTKKSLNKNGKKLKQLDISTFSRKSASTSRVTRSADKQKSKNNSPATNSEKKKSKNVPSSVSEAKMELSSPDLENRATYKLDQFETYLQNLNPIVQLEPLKSHSTITDLSRELSKNLSYTNDTSTRKSARFSKSSNFEAQTKIEQSKNKMVDKETKNDLCDINCEEVLVTKKSLRVPQKSSSKSESKIQDSETMKNCEDLISGQKKPLKTPHKSGFESETIKNDSKIEAALSKEIEESLNMLVDESISSGKSGEKPSRTLRNCKFLNKIENASNKIVEPPQTSNEVSRLKSGGIAQMGVNESTVCNASDPSEGLEKPRLKRSLGLRRRTEQNKKTFSEIVQDLQEEFGLINPNQPVQKMQEQNPKPDYQNPIGSPPNLVEKHIDDDIFDRPTQILNPKAPNDLDNNMEELSEIFGVSTQRLAEPIEINEKEPKAKMPDIQGSNIGESQRNSIPAILSMEKGGGISENHEIINETELHCFDNGESQRNRVPVISSTERRGIISQSSTEGSTQNHEIIVEVEVHRSDDKESQRGTIEPIFEDDMDIEETVQDRATERDASFLKCLDRLNVIQNDIILKNNVVEELSQFLLTTKSLFSFISEKGNSKVLHNLNEQAQSCPTLSTEQEVVNFYNTAIPHLNKLRELYVKYEIVVQDMTERTKCLKEIFGQNSEPLNLLLNSERCDMVFCYKEVVLKNNKAAQTDFELKCIKCQGAIENLNVDADNVRKVSEIEISQKKVNRQLNFVPIEPEKKYKRIRNQSDSDSDADLKKKLAKRDNPFDNENLNVIFISDQKPNTREDKDTQDITEKCKNILEREFRELKSLKTPEIFNNSFGNDIETEMNLPFENEKKAAEKETQFSKSLFTENDNFNKTILYNAYRPLEVHKINADLEKEFNNSFKENAMKNCEKSQRFGEKAETQFTKSLFTESNFNKVESQKNVQKYNESLSLFTEKPNSEMDKTVCDLNRDLCNSPKDLFDEKELDNEVALHLSNSSFVADSLEGSDNEKDPFENTEIIEGSPDKTPFKRKENSTKSNLDAFVTALKQQETELDLQNTEWLHSLAPPPEFQDTEIQKPLENSLEIINKNLQSSTPEFFSFSSPKTNQNILNERVNLSDITNNSLNFINSQVSQKSKNKSVELFTNQNEQNKEILKEQSFNPLSIVQSQQSSALTLVKSKAYVPKTISNTPKQTSIFNFMKTPMKSSLTPKKIDKNLDQILNDPMDITPIKLKSKKEICLACTRLKVDESSKLISMTENFNLSFSKQFTNKVTHLVVTVDDRNRIKDLTMKYVSAIANGIWIVSFLWVQECLQHDRILPEEQYEVLDISGLPGPQKSRLTRKTKPLFKDFVFYCSEPFESVTKADLENVLTNLGAEIAPTLAAIKKKGKISLVLTEYRSSQDFDIYQHWFENMNIITVEIEWLSRSVGQYEITSVRPFMLCEDNGAVNNDYPPYLLAVVPESLTECTDAFTERP